MDAKNGVFESKEVWVAKKKYKLGEKSADLEFDLSNILKFLLASLYL